MLQCPKLARGTVFSICVCWFGFVSDFGFRVSDLEDRLPVVLFRSAPGPGSRCRGAHYLNPGEVRLTHFSMRLKRHSTRPGPSLN